MVQSAEGPVKAKVIKKKKSKRVQAEGEVMELLYYDEKVPHWYG